MQHHVYRDRTWNNHKPQSPKNACRTISTEERCRQHCFRCISVSTWGSDQRTWLHKLHTWIPRDCMIRLKTNQSSQSHTTSTENKNQFAIQPLHLSIADFYTQTLLHTDAFTHRHFYTQMLLHTNTFTHRRFCTQTLLHTDSFTHRRFYTLHTDTFTHRPFYTQTLLRTDHFTHRHFYTQKLLNTEAFTHRSFYTQTPLHTDHFTHKCFYTETLLHTVTFTHRSF